MAACSRGEEWSWRYIIIIIIIVTMIIYFIYKVLFKTPKDTVQ